MKHLPTELLYLLKIYNYVMFEIGLDSARSRAEEIREYIASCTFLKDHPGLFEYLSPEKSMEDIITYIKRNEKTYEMLGEWKHGECDSLFESRGLDNCIHRAVISDKLVFKRTDTKDAYIEFDDGNYSYTKLILVGAELSEDVTITEELLWYEFYRNRDGRLCLEMFTESLETVKIEFNDFTCEKVFYNATEAFPFWDNPYEYICDMASIIYHKHRSDPSLLCKEENDILPIVEFLHFLNLSNLGEASKDATDAFISLLREYGLTKQEKLLVKLSEKKKFSVYNRNKLINALSLAEGECLWRRLYNDICNSQKDVQKSPSQLRCEQMTELQDKISDLLHKNGYEGTYPNFRKKGNISGLHLAKSYGLDYFVANEKNAMFFIKPQISFDYSGEALVSFLSGTILSRKNDETPEDIYSALFNAKGKRFFIYTHSHEVLDGELEKAVLLAVKRAELKKLTKEEKNDVSRTSVLESISYGLLFGLLFSLLFFPVMGAIVAIALLCAGMIGDFFTCIPWIPLFILSVFLSSVMMAITSYISDRR